MSSPFQVFTLIPPGDFTGRANVISLVCNQLADNEFRSTALVGGPYTGKTSLLRYFTSQEGQAVYPVLANSWNVYIPGDVLGLTATPALFWASCFRELQRQVDAGDLKARIADMAERTRKEKFDIFDIEDFLDECAEKQRRLVLFIDDFVNLLRNQNFWPPNDFFHQVRYLAHRTPRTLAFVVGTPRPLIELWDLSQNASPFYNSLLSVAIGRLIENDVRTMVRKTFAKLQLQSSNEIEQLVLEASGSHPALVTYISSLCADMMKSGGEIDVDKLYKAFGDPDGPIVGLIRRIREELDLTEREWVDTAKASPEKLSEAQIDTLRKLWARGLIQPGVKIP